MDLREAHEILGIDETVPADAARRAYLKLLKKHRPESDPDGFQRIRTAHELVASHRSRFSHRVTVTSANVEASLPLEERPAVEIESAAETEASPLISIEAAAHQVAASAEHELSWFARMNDEVEQEKRRDGDADWAVFFSERVPSCSDPDDVWDLYYELDDDEAIAAALLRAAAQAGFAGFEDSLALTLPQLATPQELTAAEQSGHDDSILFPVFLAAGDLERAGPAAVRALESEHAERISGYLLIELLFALEASGSERGGPLLFDKINEHIARCLDEPELFGHCVTSWILASEYFADCSRLAPAGRIFVGEVCRSMDWQAAPELAMKWRPGGTATRAQVLPPLRHVLSTSAPTLFSVLFPAAAPATAVVPHVEASASSGIPWWAITLLVLGGLRLLRACGHEEGLPSFVPSLLPQDKQTEQLEGESLRGNYRSDAPSHDTPPDGELGVASKNDPAGVDGWFGARVGTVASFHRASLANDCPQMENDLGDLGWFQSRAPEADKEKAAAENERLRLQYIEECESKSDNE